MPKIKINRDRCKGCYLCIAYCPKGLIVVEPRLNKLGVKPAQFSPGKAESCSGCALCCVMCPEVCIEAYKD